MESGTGKRGKLCQTGNLRRQTNQNDIKDIGKMFDKKQKNI